LMSTYFRLAFQPNSAAQDPEKLYREPLLMTEAVLISVSMIALFYFDIPPLGRIFRPLCHRFSDFEFAARR
jgi:decaprenyl-phosphate phosphoribosyltransferase